MKLILSLIIICFSYGFYAQKDIFQTVRNGNLKALKILIAADSSSINKINSRGYSPLIIAAYHNKPEILNLLLDAGANVNYIGGQGNALHASSFKNDLEAVKILLSYNIEINKKDSNGSTALIYATLNKNYSLTALLVKNGADWNIKDNGNMSALDYANERKDNKFLNLFK